MSSKKAAPNTSKLKLNVSLKPALQSYTRPGHGEDNYSLQTTQQNLTQARMPVSACNDRTTQFSSEKVHQTGGISKQPYQALAERGAQLHEQSELAQAVQLARKQGTPDHAQLRKRALSATRIISYKHMQQGRREKPFFSNLAAQKYSMAP